MLQAIPWQEMESSNVGHTYYDERTNVVCVKFNNGGLYTYMGPTMEVYMSFIHAPSVGHYLHHVLKTYPYTRWESEDALLKSLNI